MNVVVPELAAIFAAISFVFIPPVPLPLLESGLAISNNSSVIFVIVFIIFDFLGIPS